MRTKQNTNDLVNCQRLGQLNRYTHTHTHTHTHTLITVREIKREMDRFALSNCHYTLQGVKETGLFSSDAVEILSETTPTTSRTAEKVEPSTVSSSSMLQPYWSCTVREERLSYMCPARDITPQLYTLTSLRYEHILGFLKHICVIYCQIGLLMPAFVVCACFWFLLPGFYLTACTGCS